MAVLILLNSSNGFASVSISAAVTRVACWLRSNSLNKIATAFMMLAPSAGRMAVSWNKMDAREVLEYSWSGMAYWREMSLSTASSTVTISFTAMAYAFFRSVGVNVLMGCQVDDLQCTNCGDRLKEGEGWWSDVACVRVLGPIFVGIRGDYNVCYHS